MNRMSWPKRWPTWKDSWRTLMPSQQHDRLPTRHDSTPCFAGLGTQPWSTRTRNCTKTVKGDSTRGTRRQPQEPCRLLVCSPEANWLASWIPLPAVVLQEEGLGVGWGRAIRRRKRSGIQAKKWTWAFIRVRFRLGAVTSPAFYFPVFGHSHLCTILFVCFYFIVSFLLKTTKKCNLKKEKKKGDLCCFPQP